MKREEGKISRKMILLISLIIEVGIVVFLPLLVGFFSPSKVFSVFVLVPSLLVAGLVFFCLVYFWWAPNNLYFTFVPEGRAKVVVKGDAFQRILIQWKGYNLKVDSEIDQVHDIGDITKGGSRQGGWFEKLFGGLKYYGFWPIKDIFIYDFSWTGINPNGEPQRHKKETLDYVLLKEDVYWVEILQAEDKALLPLDVQLVLPIRVINPYKALFRIQNWLEAVISRIAPAVRDRITEEEYREWIQSDKNLGQEIFEDLKKNDVFAQFEQEYGVRVRATEVRAINPGDKFREASLKEYLAQREAERIKIVYGAIKDQGDLGKLIRVVEGIENGEGNWVIPIPGGLTELLSKLGSEGSDR